MHYKPNKTGTEDRVNTCVPTVSPPTFGPLASSAATPLLAAWRTRTTAPTTRTAAADSFMAALALREEVGS